MIENFNMSRIPMLRFGAGTFGGLGKVIKKYGSRVLVVTGGKSLVSSGRWDELLRHFKESEVEWDTFNVSGEPSPGLIDSAVQDFRKKKIDVVLSIGGGSVLDAGKSISAMLLQEGSVKEFLEGVGNRVHDGRKLPFVAVPTTAGTGSEATKNAVLSEIGKNGFKKSLRHESLVPEEVIIDPGLMRGCPRGVTAASGMDALTQLLESYISNKANPITDALAISGIEHAVRCLIPVCTDKGDDLDARAGMAYAAFISGVTLTGAGIGVIHGLASSIGGYFNAPHGAVCGTLLAPAMKRTIHALENEFTGGLALEKCARVGAIVSGREFRTSEIANLCRVLIDTLYEWTDHLSMPRLGTFGITGADVERIVQGASNKNNPVALPGDEIAAIVFERI